MRVKKTKLPFFLVGLTLLLFSGVYSLKAKKIECYTQFGLCEETILSQLAWLKGTRLLLPLPKTKAASVLSHIPQVGSLNLYRRLPDTIVASVMARFPLAGITTRVLGSQTALVDSSGFVFAHTSITQVPKLYLDSLPEMSQTVSPEILQSLNVLRMVNLLETYPPSGVLSGQTLSIILNDHTEVLFTVSKDPGQKQASLQQILNRSKMSSKRPTIIDLRYSSPVLTY